MKYWAASRSPIFIRSGASADGTEPVTNVIIRKGILYGITSSGGANDSGTLFSLDPNNGTYAVLYSFGSGADDARNPYGDPIDANGALHGTTRNGGVHGGGTVFAITLP